MFGKFFASTFSGSMVGAGPTVFAVWGYVIANVHDSQVELNPKLLASVIGTTEQEIIAAIEFLCAPDTQSRSKAEDGRRLVREGQFAYHVVNHSQYRGMRHEEDRREYNRLKKRESRAKQKVKQDVKPVSHGQPPSAYTEAEAEAEGRAKTASPTPLMVGKDFGLSASACAHGVITELQLGGTGLLKTIATVIDGHIQKGADGEKVAERMIAAYRYHQKTETARGRDPQKPGFFFGDGDWEAWAQKAEASSLGSGQSLRERVDAQLAGGGQ